MNGTNELCDAKTQWVNKQLVEWMYSILSLSDFRANKIPSKYFARSTTLQKRKRNSEKKGRWSETLSGGFDWFRLGWTILSFSSFVPFPWVAHRYDYISSDPEVWTAKYIPLPFAQRLANSKKTFAAQGKKPLCSFFFATFFTHGCERISRWGKGELANNLYAMNSYQDPDHSPNFPLFID